MPTRSGSNDMIDLGPLIGSIDQGTSGTKFLVFAAQTSQLVTYHQVSVSRTSPKSGWVEQDPMELIQSVIECIETTVENLKALRVDPGDIVAIGLTNQRETTLMWNKITGEPLSKAILWMDTRAEVIEQKVLSKLPKGPQSRFSFLPRTGLPISSYFSALKIRWLLENDAKVKKALSEDSLLFGTVDSWIMWNLTGESNDPDYPFRSQGIHLTDVTNASRTMLMNIETLEWDPDMCKFFEIPMKILPEIRPCSGSFGTLNQTSLKGVVISGCIGDQQAALVGHHCFRPGQTKTTMGTGCFILCNTGHKVIYSKHGLISTVAYQLGKDKPPVYALEGSLAVAGSGLQWLQDNLKVVQDTNEVESLVAASGDSEAGTHDVYFVPSFSGLFAPHWRPDSRGIICGLDYSSSREHLCKAMLESIAFQTREILSAMNSDSQIEVNTLLVDGGMAKNDCLVQIHANILGIPILRSTMSENSALGAAIIAGSAQEINVWDMTACIEGSSDKFLPRLTHEERDIRFERWQMAVERSLNWHQPKAKREVRQTLEERQLSLNSRRILTSVPPAIFIFSSILILKFAAYVNDA